MLYDDINKVLEDIRVYFESLLGESFNLSRSYRDDFATYKSESYIFDVMASFIQARVKEDFNVPITERIDRTITSHEIKKNTHYRLISRIINGEIPIEYFLEVIEK